MLILIRLFQTTSPGNCLEWCPVCHWSWWYHGFVDDNQRFAGFVQSTEYQTLVWGKNWEQNINIIIILKIIIFSILLITYMVFLFN